MKDLAAISLHVYVITPGGDTLYAGRIISRNLASPDRKEGFFKYSEDYLRHPEAYPLDPIHLPLGTDTFKAARGESGMHAVFDDSLPDAWGRTILAKRAGLDKTRFTSAHLLEALKDSGLGCLLYSSDNNQVAKSQNEKGRGFGIEFARISLAIGEASLFEKNMDTENQELQHLLACGSSAGGARPKVLVQLDGQGWLAKFSSIRDTNPSLLVSLEQAGMLLARQAGLEIPEVQRRQVSDRDILLIKRFDIASGTGRNALVSMRTLTGSENPYLMSYADMATIIRKISARPDVDTAALFRWMLVNVLLQNTDDHLQNFSMLHTRDGWRLSPGYDITPNIHQERHILRVNNCDGPLSRQDILAEGRRFGLSAQKCRRLFDEVCERLQNWEEMFDACAVPWEHTRNLRISLHQKWKLLHIA